jgi:prophage tail gpP-like protein
VSTKKAIVSIVIDGEEFFGWDQYSIESNMLTPSDAFHLSAPNVGGKLAEKFSAVAGKKFKILLDGEQQMAGVIDESTSDVDPGGARWEIQGRDPIGQLHDCSAAPATYTSMKLDAIAKKIAADFIPEWEVGDDVTLTAHASVKIDPGESIMDVLTRLAKQQDVVIWCDAEGVGQIDRPDYTTAPVHLLRLRIGDGWNAANNVTRSRVMRSVRERFSTITVYGHGSNTSGTYGSSARHKSSATDDSFDENIRLLIVSDGDAKTAALANTRANREVADRKMHGLEIELSVRGHYGTPASGDASLYQVNQMVDLIEELAGLDGKFWVARRRFECDETGQHTTLTLHESGLWLA